MTKTRLTLLALAVLLGLLTSVVTAPRAQQALRARDPGPRGGPDAAGGPLPGLTGPQMASFEAGRADFLEEEGVGDGLGPRFNLNSCGGCHVQGGVGGSSPAVNPQVAMATAMGARNTVPFFIKPDGPIREVRFKLHADGTRDGGVHALFIISGRVDPTGNASACNIRQEDFATQGRANNLIFRIPTRVFGAGLIEQIPDSAIVAIRPRPRPRKVRSASAGDLPGSRSTAPPTSTATTAPSPASAGRPRTSRCSCSPARPTTSRWASATNCSKPSVTRPRTVSSR